MHVYNAQTLSHANTKAVKYITFIHLLRVDLIYLSNLLINALWVIIMSAQIYLLCIYCEQ